MVFESENGVAGRVSFAVGLRGEGEKTHRIQGESVKEYGQAAHRRVKAERARLDVGVRVSVLIDDGE